MKIILRYIETCQDLPLDQLNLWILDDNCFHFNLLHNCRFQAEDLIEDLLSLETSPLAGDTYKRDGSLSSNSNDLNIKNEPLILSDAELHALAKDRQKKDNHNMSK